MNYHPLTWLTWFAWGFFMSCGWACGMAFCAWVRAQWIAGVLAYHRSRGVPL